MAGELGQGGEALFEDREMKKLLLLLLLTSCSFSEQPLQFNLGAENVQLDWSKAIDTSSVMVLDNIMEGLTSYADSVGADFVRPLPALADSWSISEEGKLYQFHLREGVVWSDGVPLTAQQFVDSWQRLLSPQENSPNAYQLFELEGAEAYHEGKEKDFSQVGVRALDANTLQVRLKRKVPYFLHLVASPSTFPFRKDLWEKFGKDWIRPDNLVTLGAYSISDWVEGDHLVLDRFRKYWGKAPTISRVICRMIAEPITAYALYKNGALDILPKDLPASLLEQLQTSPEFRTGPKLQVSYLLLNWRKAPFQTKEARRAFARSLNRDQLARFFRGSQLPTGSWIPPGLPGFAKELSGEGDAAKSLAGSVVEIKYSGSDTWNLVFQAMQKQLEAKLGLRSRPTQIDSLEYRNLLDQISPRAKSKVDMLPNVFLLGWVADYPDAHSFMNVFTSRSEANYSRWKNAQYDGLVGEAVATDDDGKRSALYGRAQKILLEEEAILVPLFYSSHLAMVKENLRGVRLNVLDKWYFRTISFERTGWGGGSRSLFGKLRHISGT